MTHFWIRAEQRENERRVPITPEGAARLIASGAKVTVEDSASRIIPVGEYREAGCDIVAEGDWPDAPPEAIIVGLKELPDDGTPLRHRHVMFGHAFKGQPDGRRLLRRFAEGGGTLFDLEYLTDAGGRRLAAFGYWAGYTGAAVTLKAWAAQQRGEICPPVSVFSGADALAEDVGKDLAGLKAPRAIVIGALGRVGTGARDLCRRVGVVTTDWDMAETAHGGPFPEILAHDVFLNCILATPGCPVFVPADAVRAERSLTAIGDIACDPTSEFSPIKVYDSVTSWSEPVRRVHDAPPLDVMAIDNLPSLLPLESSLDFAEQLLPCLLRFGTHGNEWERAREIFERNVRTLEETGS